jgi:NADPH:quinone reductase-like Zn-dependent oxidoreductase/thioesterase domain-containing protein/short-subunit dehydrogenase/acyl carrier protein
LELIQSAGRAIPANPIRSFVVTRGANAIAAGEQGHVSLAPLLGLARAAANEFPRFQVTRLDLDPDSSSFDRLIPDLLGGCVDQEVAYRGERRYVPRIGKLEFDRLGLRRKRVRLHARTDRSYKVVSSKPGTLDRVTLEIAERRAPRAGEIEIRVAGAGLNFLDVLRSLNLGPGQRPGPATFGMELSGEVTRVGENGAAFQPGQRVMALADFTEGCFQAYATIRDRLAFSVPPEFSMEQSAGCLVPYQTAWYALVELGRMRAGDKVLIHAAAGGVGLAAVHIARLIGAEIFATAGSPEKREYLSRLGVPHVMDSRTLEFSEQVLTATAGRGVDLVLNSISGEAIPKSLATLAMGGRFLEIGKRDIYANSAIDLLPFRRNLSFHAVDILGLMGEREDMVLRVTREVVDRLASGELPPLPFTAFPASRARDAFHYMAQSKQIGKVIVTFEETEVEAEIPEDRIVRPDASYLITGGLAGIGLECARWLAGRGARHLALVARRKPNASELDAIAKLRGAGVEVMTAIQDVADRDGVRRLIDAIDRDMPPLAGVIHSAGIARDGILERLSWDQFQEVFAPKLEGSWNLHNILLDRDLDFFVLFSSVASWLGSAGQANYAAANAFLDSLGEHRERRGLPVLVVNWGPWTGLGMLERHKLQPSPIFGEQGIRPEQGIACLSALLTKDCAQATVMSADWTVWRQSDPALAANPLFANLRNEMGAQSADREPADSLAVELAGLLRSDGVALIRGRLTKEVVRVLRVSEDRLDAHTSLQRFGLDSLMAVELSNRIQDTLGAQVPVMALLNGPSIEELATALYGRIGVAAGVEPNQVSHDSRAAPMILVHNRTRAAQIRQDSCVIQEDGSQLPLFFLGGLPEWTFIAQQLGEDQPLIGVVPRHIYSEGRPRIADFAASVVSTIRQHQPEGPYRLAGWSIGGLIAFEAAQQLIAAGDDVQSLTIVDTFLPLASRKLVGAQKFTAWARLERKRLMYHLQKLRHAELTADYVRQRFGSLVDSRLRPILASALGGKKPVGDVRSSKELHDLIMAASMTYEAQSYAGRVLLCAAADRPIGPEWDYVTAWKSVLTGDVEVEVAEGNHLTMFDPENVQPLVDKLRVHLSVRSTVLGHKAG